MTLPRFRDLIIVELAGSAAGGYCGKLFDDHGAQVTLVGDGDVDQADDVYLHGARRRVERVDPDLLARADVIIESSAVEPLLPAPAGDDRPAVRVRLSPFGTTGPYAGWTGADIVEQAVSGHLYLNGDPEREPLIGPPLQPAYAAGLFGFVGAMAALFARGRSGVGQTVEVSHVEAMTALHQFTFLRYLSTGDVLRRMGNRFAGQGQPNGLYPCADGWVAIAAPTDVMVDRLLDIAGLEHLLDHPDITSPLDFQTHPRVLDDALIPWLAEQTVTEVVELLQAVRIPCAPASTILGLLRDEQLQSRGYWRAGSANGVMVPGPPLRLSGHAWRSPCAGEDPAGPAAGGQRRRDDGDVETSGPLAGLRVLDLTRVWAGPLATRILAELGADVVWVEAPWSRGPRRFPPSMVQATRYFPDDDQGECPWNRNGHYVKYALGKRSVVLDLQDERAVAAVEAMVPWADVLIENYSPRVMPQLGLDEERLHELNPDLVYVTMPGYGRSGPAENWLAFGSSVDSHAGLSSLVGYPDASPWKGGIAWPDPVTGLHATCGALIALWDREAGSTRGQTVETSMLEAAVAAIGGSVVAAQVAGREPQPLGNRSGQLAPQGVYPCQGEDRWIAICVQDDVAWRALCDEAGFDERLTALDREERRAAHDEIDAAIAGWTSGFEHRELMARLQERGVAAGAVLDAAELVSDPHLEARGAWVEVDQPAIGAFRTPLMPIRLSRTPAQVRRPAPLLGQHNREVLRDLAGLHDDLIAALEADDVVTDRPPA